MDDDSNAEKFMASDSTAETVLQSNTKADVIVANESLQEANISDITKLDGHDPERILDDPEIPQEDKSEDDAPLRQRIMEVIKAYWMIGLIAFGGPSAHVGILRDHLVVQRNWMSEEAFMELFAIGQGLPGATSTQLVISTATQHAGPIGGLIAFFFWNLPGLIVLTVCGILIATFVNPDTSPWYLIGIPPAAITLVFVAFYQFCQSLDKVGVVLALLTALMAIWIEGDTRVPRTSAQYLYPAMLVLGGTVTFIDSNLQKPFGVYKSASAGWNSTDDRMIQRIGIPMWAGTMIFLLFAVILATTITLVRTGAVDNVYLEIFEVMFRVGSITFGGGQVILPLLGSYVVPNWISKDEFLQGLGLTQSLPGPLFNFSAFIGAAYKGIPGALLAWAGLFGPGIMLVFAVLPFWAQLRHKRWFKCVLSGLNAVATGLVGAACVSLFEVTVLTRADAMVFAFALTLATAFEMSAPIVVISGWAFGAVISEYALSLGQVPYCDSSNT